MLTTSREQYRRQQRLTAMAVVEARRRRRRSIGGLAGSIINYQLAAIALSLQYGAAQLAEQGIDAPAAAGVNPSALVTPGAAISTMLSRTGSEFGFDRLVATLVQDAGRTASTVDIARRPAVTGYVRSLTPPSCSRCAVLAGRVYRYSTGFLRHPQCDCLMTATTEAVGEELVTDAMAAVKAGQVRGLSQDDMAAIDLGADLGQVVNVRRTEAGLTVGSSVMERGGRPTPAGILRAAGDDRTAAIGALRRWGYLR